MNDPILYGKNPTTRVVAIEPQDGYLEVFRQLENGTIESSFLEDVYYWILSSRHFDGTWSRLKGNLDYKFGKQFATREEFLDARRELYGQGKNVFSVFDPIESSLLTTGLTYFKDMKPEEVSILSFDIETTGLKHNKDAKVLLISSTFRQNQIVERRLFGYDDYKSEGEMLEAWCSWVREKNPSVMVGHNIFGFDIPYLQYCASRNNVLLELGRDGSPLVIEDFQKRFRVDGNRELHYNNAKIYGRSLVDTMFLAIRKDISREYDSYGLKWIINYENWEVKGRQFYDAGSIKDHYLNKEEWKKIKKYAEHDGDDALKLYDEFIPPFFYLQQSVPKSFQTSLQSASGSQLNSIMMRAYLQDCHSLPKASEVYDFEGAISFGKSGVYSNVFKIDVASLYPSLILQYEIFDQEKDPNGYLLYLTKAFREERLRNKKLAQETGDIKYSHIEQSQKISINSLYGFLGATGLLFNYPEGASEITRRGRETLQQTIKWAESNQFTVCNADTDSVSICKSDQALITKEERQEVLDNINSTFPEHIKFSDDGYYPRLIVIKAKNYVLMKEDGKVKYKGSALKSPALEPAFNEFIKQVVESILHKKNDYKEIYHKYINECFYLTDIKRFGARKTISDKTLESDRTNEEKIRQAIEGSDYKEGDRIRVYFDMYDNLKLIENYDRDHSVLTLVKKLYKTGERFSTVLDTESLFKDLSLKKNRKELYQIWNIPPMLLDVPKYWDDIVINSMTPELVNFVETIDFDHTLPLKENILRAFHYFKPKATQVIIIGQDPYPNKEDACGLAFSSESGKIPPSLKNIFEEIKTDVGIERTNADLTDLAEQNVLLLNSVLTVEEGKSASHSDLGWEKFTTKVIQQIINMEQPLVILAWGKYAKDKLEHLNLHDKVKVIIGAHPSPLAQGKFFGGRYFSQTNEFLVNNGKAQINW